MSNESFEEAYHNRTLDLVCQLAGFKDHASMSRALCGEHPTPTEFFNKCHELIRESINGEEGGEDE